MDPLYTLGEAAERLRVSPSWLKKRVSARAIPHTRIGRHIRFTDDHLAQIAASGEQEAVPFRRATA